jgi:quaternary ammonium compound-resistance protein SugE
MTTLRGPALVAQKSCPRPTSDSGWVGIGAVGTTFASIVLFDEPASLLRIGRLWLLAAGKVGLEPSSSR